jgi:hypothetical protein
MYIYNINNNIIISLIAHTGTFTINANVVSPYTLRDLIGL